MKTATMILAAQLAAGVLLAQPGQSQRGERPAPKVDAVQQHLNLTDGQIEQLRGLQWSFRETARADFEQNRAKAQQLREEMAKDNPNPSLVGQLTVELREARDAMREKRAQLRQEALNLLTDQQKAALAELENARKLAPAIREATMLNLLEAPEGRGDGPGFGPGSHGRFGMRGGPRGR
jgi:Spy/CpxP family protein refolding chaperone